MAVPVMVGHPDTEKLVMLAGMSALVTVIGFGAAVSAVTV
jgi:hypothetical protein